MRKINTYYRRSIAWTNLLTISLGCSHHSENHMTAIRSLMQNVRGTFSSIDLYVPDDGLEAIINILLEKLQECCRFIDDKRNDCSIGNIMEMNSELQCKRYIKRHYNLMPYNDMSDVYCKRISKERIQDFGDLKTLCASVPLRNLACLSLWEKDFSEQFKKSLKNSPQVLHYFYNNLLPYWAEIVQLLIFHALNTSIAQGKILLSDAEQKYKEVCETIKAIYSSSYIANLKKCCRAQFEKAIEYGSRKHGYGCIEIIEQLKKNTQKLKQYTLQPIEDVYTALTTLVDKIKYKDEPKLKEKIADSLKMFYNIAYSFGIIDLIANLHLLLSVYNPNMECGEEQVERCLKKLSALAKPLLTVKRSLIEFITGMHTGFDQVSNEVSQLISPLRHLLAQAENQP
ncbi:hypothetical protein [Cardinium endosymbiont of Nabis limbatus]|uniref:hypothetical protein n=1 Tax=Cardinium endosymbiont of Nabis limbatus TaxID=3066217 RepID=UPI003AF3989C